MSSSPIHRSSRGGRPFLFRSQSGSDGAPVGVQAHTGEEEDDGDDDDDEDDDEDDV